MHVEEIKNLFSITKVLVLGHSDEILDVKVTDSKDPSWKKQKISHPQVVKWTKAKVHVHSDSVLRLGELSALPDAAERWKGQLVDFQTTVSNQEFYGIDGEPIEWEWNILPGFTLLAMLRKVQDELLNSNIKPENFGDRIILMSMFNDIDWNKKTMKESVFQNPKKSEIMRRDFRKDIGRSWTKTCGEIVWISLLQARRKIEFRSSTHTTTIFEETDNPIFTSVSAMNRGVLERVKSQETVHFTEETPNTELLFRIIHSANQFSMYGAVWSWSGQPSPNETEPILEKFVTSEESVNTVTLKSVSSQEMRSLVDSARSRHVSGNRGRDDLQDIYFLEEPYWIARICEVASFWNLVQTGKHYKTHPDMKDGFWRLHTSMPRVLTTSNWRTLNSAWCDSRRNCVPTSTTLYSGKKLGNVWNWTWHPFTE